MRLLFFVTICFVLIGCGQSAPSTARQPGDSQLRITLTARPVDTQPTGPKLEVLPRDMVAPYHSPVPTPAEVRKPRRALLAVIFGAAPLSAEEELPPY